MRYDRDDLHEIDCHSCDEGVFQWTWRDEISICDHCGYEIKVDDLAYNKMCQLYEVE
jgi:hypothetical protein